MVLDWFLQWKGDGEYGEITEDRLYKLRDEKNMDDGCQSVGHPGAITPGAVGHLAKGQWSASAPHQAGPKLS